MSYKDVKSHHRYRSRSRSREKNRQKRRYSDSDDSSGSYSKYRSADRSRSKSRERSKHKKHKDRSRSRERYRESRSGSKKRGHRSRSISKERKRRSRSRDKSKKKKSKDKKRDRSRDREKKSKSKRSYSSESSESSVDMKKLQKMSLEEIEIMKEERRKQREALKAIETPEQKRARRLAKKEAKERKRKEQMGWDEEYMGYTNTDNPFGDERLLDTFVWRRKMEKEGKKHLTKSDIQKEQKQKMEENSRELEKVKKRRLEREREMAERDKERELIQREKEADFFKEWEKQEDQFHLQQAKLRSKIRIDDGRAKPIDLLAKYITAEDDDFAVEMHEPYTYLNGLTMEDLEDLLEDIKVYTEMDADKNTDYWKDVTVVVDDELCKLRKLDTATRDMVIRDRREGINASVMDDVANIFKGKTHNQLILLQQEVKKKLKGGEGIDVGYWESLLQQLLAHMARTRLRERHQENLRTKLFKLKQEQGIEAPPLFPIMREESDSGSERVASRKGTPVPSALASASADSGSERVASRKGTPVPSTLASTSADDAVPGTSAAGASGEEFKTPADVETAEKEDDQEEEEDELEESILTEDDLMEERYKEYEAGSYSPKLIRPMDVDIDTVVYDPADDMKKLEYMRQQVLKTGKVKADQESEFVKRAREGMNDDEATFSVEFKLDQQSFLWTDKYRPRKPRFFNRVHTGFEWNKYNQTHYDIDNPPPKIVQGYKFNIFYPDLIDKAVTPEYTLTPIEDNKDFAVLKFHAGPPYEDIAFKIVSREWEYSYKRGFRCQFQNNIFQLWFHFKRYRYRR